MEVAAPFDPAACFAGLIGLAKSMLGRLVRPRDPALVAEALALYGYLGRQSRRFERLVARIRAGTLPPLPERPVAPPPAPPGPRTIPEPAGEEAIRHARAKIPRRRAWLLHEVAGTPGAAAAGLQQLLDRPETRALFAAEPVRMARLLRPLWRLFSADPLPALLRRPPRPPRRRDPSRRLRRLSFQRGVPPSARLGYGRPGSTAATSEHSPVSGKNER